MMATTPRAKLAAERLRREMREQLTRARAMLGMPRYAHERARIVRDVRALERALGEVRR